MTESRVYYGEAVAHNTVRRHRVALGVSQTRLAEATGTTRLTISNIERGVHFPRIALAVRIAEQLGVCTDVLFGALDTTAETA